MGKTDKESVKELAEKFIKDGVEKEKAYARAISEVRRRRKEI